MIIYYDSRKIGHYNGIPSIELCMAMTQQNDDDVLSPELISITPETKEESVALVRSGIEKSVGDNASLLGTTSDATHLLLYGFTSLIAKLHNANSLADVKEAAAPFAELSAGFQERLENGEVKLPFMDKGLDVVVGDIERRATVVADVLHQAAPSNDSSAEPVVATEAAPETTEAEQKSGIARFTSGAIAAITGRSPEGDKKGS